MRGILFATALAVCVVNGAGTGWAQAGGTPALSPLAPTFTSTVQSAEGVVCGLSFNVTQTSPKGGTGPSVCIGENSATGLQSSRYEFCNLETGAPLELNALDLRYDILKTAFIAKSRVNVTFKTFPGSPANFRRCLINVRIN